MKDYTLRIIVSFLLPYILLYGLYIHFNGEIAPGGGFQSGCILASSYMLYGITYGYESFLRVLPTYIIKLLGISGGILYIIIGLAGIKMGGNFLSFNNFSLFPLDGQALGIFLVELSVALAVFASMCLIFAYFVGREKL